MVNSSAIANNFARFADYAQNSGKYSWSELREINETSEKLHDIASNGKQYNKTNFPLLGAVSKHIKI